MDRIVRLAMSDPLDAYEEGLREGWKLALAWAGIPDEEPTTHAALVACVDPSPSDSGSTDPEVRQSADRTSSPSRVPGEDA